MHNVEIFYSEECEAWELVVDGEWYFEGNYEQINQMAETFWFNEDDYEELEEW